MTIPLHIAAIILAVRAALAAYAGRTRAHAALLLLVRDRTQRAATRLDRLFARWQQGTLRPTRPRAAAKPAAQPTTPPTGQDRPPPRPRLPEGQGWLVHLVPDAAPAGAAVHAFVHRPDVADFVAAVPRAGRYIRPFCRMQGVVLPDYLRLPPRPRKPRPPRPRTKRPPPRHDLPPHVRRAGRVLRNPSIPPEPARPAAAPPTPPPVAPKGFGPPRGFDLPRGFDEPRGFATPWDARRRR